MSRRFFFSQKEFDNQPLTMEVDVDTSMEKQIIFGQAWQWFKERRRITSPPIKTAITYVSLPWYLIISGKSRLGVVVVVPTQV